MYGKDVVFLEKDSATDFLKLKTELNCSKKSQISQKPSP